MGFVPSCEKLFGWQEKGGCDLFSKWFETQSEHAYSSWSNNKKSVRGGLRWQLRLRETALKFAGGLILKKRIRFKTLKVVNWNWFEAYWTSSIGSATKLWWNRLDKANPENMTNSFGENNVRRTWTGGRTGKSVKWIFMTVKSVCVPARRDSQTDCNGERWGSLSFYF